MIKLMYITNRADIAKIAENNGVDRIFIDLEILGKDKRQGHLDTVISRHSIEDIMSVKSCLEKSELLVRCNPIHENSKEEIDTIIKYGADIIMLPYFKTVSEVKTFLDIVDNRVKTNLLLETPEAVEVIDEILKLQNIDEIHIGLNDLHLGYKLRFMFELLSNGTVEMLCNKFDKAGIKSYGFGGIASLGKGKLPSEHIIAEHYRLGSTCTILSRSFCNTNDITDLEYIDWLFKEGVNDIRNFENYLYNKSTDVFYKENIRVISEIVESVLKDKK